MRRTPPGGHGDRVAVALFLFLGPLCAAMAQSQTAAPPAAPSGSGYVGSNVCKTCHADVWLNFYKNPHYKSVASGKEPPERTGCEGCHGPGQAHMAAGGGKDTIPRAFSLTDAQAGHGSLPDLPRHSISIRPTSGVPSTPSTTCRAPAATPSITRPRPSTCWPRSRASCATAATRDMRAQFEMPSRAPRERRLHGVHRLPQPAWLVRRHLAHGAAPAHGGAGAGQRRAVPEMPCRQARAVRLRASLGGAWRAA